MGNNGKCVWFDRIRIKSETVTHDLSLRSFGRDIGQKPDWSWGEVGRVDRNKGVEWSGPGDGSSVAGGVERVKSRVICKFQVWQLGE